MYNTTSTASHPIRLFQLPNSLAGDAAVTILVQCIITWLVVHVLVSRDLAAGHVSAASFVAEPRSRIARWFFLLDAASGSVAPGRVAHWPVILAVQMLRAMLMAVVSFCVLWGPSVGILTAVGSRSGNDWDFAPRWAPQIFKLVLGGALALLTTPFVALFWLLKAGWTFESSGGV